MWLFSFSMIYLQNAKAKPVNYDTPFAFFASNNDSFNLLFTEVQTLEQKLKTVDFCELSKYKNQRVLLTCLYSGVDEYWSLSPLRFVQCNSKFSVDLDFVNDYDRIPSRFTRVMAEVHNQYPTKALQIKVIGVFEADPNKRYGHLGSNNSRFLVSEILDMTLVAKRNNLTTRTGLDKH